MRKTQTDRQYEAARAQQMTEQAVATKLTATELVGKLRYRLFADRDTLEEAFEAAHSILKNNPAGMTALYIVLNTVRIITWTTGCSKWCKPPLCISCKKGKHKKD